MTPMASDLHADAAVLTAGQLLMELRSEVRTLDERMTERLVAVERKLDVMVAQDLHARIVALERAQWKLLSIWRYSIAGNSWATMAATPTAIGAGGSLSNGVAGDRLLYATRRGGVDHWRYLAAD